MTTPLAPTPKLQTTRERTFEGEEGPDVATKLGLVTRQSSCSCSALMWQPTGPPGGELFGNTAPTEI